jgi:hypothetical protein
MDLTTFLIAEFGTIMDLTTFLIAEFGTIMDLTTFTDDEYEALLYNEKTETKVIKEQRV